MLIRFGCANYKSIFSYQELLFTASSLKDPQADLIEHAAMPEKLLPSIALYGANASGKTNMIEALQFFIGFIKSSYREGQTTGIHRPIFKLNSDAKNQPSEFDIDFVLDNKHYHYGYKINNEAVIEEWLFSYAYENRKSRTILFHRSNEETNEYKFSKYLKGENKVIAKLTRANSLYLSTAAQNNHEAIGHVFNYFKIKLLYRFNKVFKLRTDHISSILKLYGTVNQVNSFFKNVGTGIEGIELKKIENKKKLNNIEDAFNFIFNRENDDVMDEVFESCPRDNIESFFDGKELEIIHKDNIGNLIPFELEEESLGTKTMISLLAPVFHVLNNGGIFVVDEIESSLHILLTLEIVKLFSRKETNPKGAQLLFTTHETNILCHDLLRRDQIWFSEKNQAGETIISPLTDYTLRNTDNIQKGYLEGRFGAIPFLGDIQKLFHIEK